MDIVCTIKREGGTKVELQGTTYHFVPKETGGPHIASVTNKKHVKRLLSIPEAYEPYIEDDEDEVEQDPADEHIELQRSASEEAQDARDALAEQGIELQKGEFGENEGATAEPTNTVEPNGNDVTDASDKGDPAADTEDATTAEPVEPAVIDPQEALATVTSAETAGDVSRPDLEAAFELLNGRKPNPQAKDETIFDRVKQAVETAEKTNDAAE